MPPKKAIIVSVIISLVSHVVMLSATGLINLPGKNHREEVLTVNLNDPSGKAFENPIAKETKNVNRQPVSENAEDVEKRMEDTVQLESTNPKYKNYLKKIKEKFEDTWVYPRAALEREEEGISVVKFSIGENGSLISSSIIKSSGSDALDQCALIVVQQAAPYEPLRGDIKISRLNIVASFQYKLID